MLSAISPLLSASLLCSQLSAVGLFVVSVNLALRALGGLQLKTHPKSSMEAFQEKSSTCLNGHFVWTFLFLRSLLPALVHPYKALDQDFFWQRLWRSPMETRALLTINLLC